MALKSGALRDAVILVAVFAVLLGGLYLYTGSWPPAVIVESGSMMHSDSEVSYGRFGTIDPGDLVLVKAIDSVADVGTLVENGDERYGKSGDVVVFYPANNRARVPIIHRAVAYVEVVGAPGSAEYWVRWSPDAPCEGGAQKRSKPAAEAERDVERGIALRNSWCVYDAEGILIPSVPVGAGATRAEPSPYRPLRSGFITKGDNPVTNTQIDQLSQLSNDERGNPVPVQFAWIDGVGRAELPWLGLIKLALAGQANEQRPPAAWTKIGSAYAPKDLWVMLGVTLFVVVGVPLLYDGYKVVQKRRASQLLPAAPASLRAEVTPEGRVALSWSHVGGTVHTYRVYRGEERIASTPGTHHEDTAAPADAPTAYSVSAVNEYGNEGPRSPAARIDPPR